MSRADIAVALRPGEGAAPPETVTAALLATARARPDEVALRWRTHGEWHAWTWREYLAQVARAVAGLSNLGVESGDRIVLMLRNRPEFHVADMAALFVGAVPVSVYNSSAAVQLTDIAGRAGAVAAVVEGQFVDRLLEARQGLPRLREVVVVSEPESSVPSGLRTFAELLDTGPADLAHLQAVHPEDLATLVYTSGTTGPPKGVEITHANVAWTVRSLVERVGRDLAGWRMISCLPMAHIAERVATHYLHAFEGTEVTTCREVRSMAEYLRDVRPTAVFSVPSLWERAHASIRALAAASPEQREPFEAAVRVGREVDAVRGEGGELTAELADRWAAADRQLSAVRELLGLDRVEIAVTTAAPISPEVVTFFRSLGVPLSELYGLSETTGPCAWDPYVVRPGDVGRPLPGCEVRLSTDGEILARGGNVCAGYDKDPRQSAEAIDPDGWLHTGDLGTLEGGRLRIVGRKKELIITEGGENVSPVNIESALRTAPLVDQACVAGDRRPYLVALVTLEPGELATWAREHGAAALSRSELLELPELREEVGRQVAETTLPFGRVEQVRRVKIVQDEWPPDSDLLTATMKIKRERVLERYAAEVDALYR